MTHLTTLLRLLLLSTCASISLSAAQHWVKVTTPHFEMYTTNNEKQARKALQVFEQVRYFFLQNNVKKQAPAGIVRIIAFSSEREYKPYRLNAGAFAYYLQSHERDYIVMQDLDPDHHQAAVHEYTHLIVQHMKLNLPIWLNEGLADLYSSLERHGTHAMVGRPVAGRVATLTQQTWMPWDVLLSVERSSPYYNDAEKMSIFYAQSWVLVHMLSLSEPYASGISRFLETVSAGASSAEAFQKVYGKSVAEVGKDVGQYMHSTSVKAALYDVALERRDIEGQAAELTDFQSGVALADLLASRKETSADGRSRLLALEQQDVHNPNIQESLGYLAWQDHNPVEAQRRFSLAVENGSKNAAMISAYAHIARANAAPAKAVAEIVRKELALMPDDSDNEIFLAELQAEDHQYGAALASLAQVHTVKPDQAYGFFSISGFVHANLNDLKNARVSANRAMQYAKTPADRRQIETLLEFLNMREHQTETADHKSASSPPPLAHESKDGDPVLGSPPRQ